METRVFLEPGKDLVVLVGAVVVGDEVQVEICWRGLATLAENIAQPARMAMARMGTIFLSMVISPYD